MRRRRERCVGRALSAGASAAVVLAALGLLASARAEAAEAPAPPCSLEAGRATHTLEVDGRPRRYHVAVGPEAGKAGRAPLAFVWHGFGGNARDIARVLDPAHAWPRAIVVAPEGLARTFPGFGATDRPGWQVRVGEHDDRDLAFFDALVVDVSRRYCVDPARVYSTGFSNGGFFSNLLGCRRGAVLAAIAPVSGGGPTPARCEGALPVRITHGRYDDVVDPRAGLESLRVWSEAASCKGGPEPAPGRCTRQPGCDVEVAYCSFDGGHTWPRGATKGIVEFFDRHARDEAEPAPRGQ